MQGEMRVGAGAVGDEFHIERMTRADLPEVQEIERACFRVPWSRECFISEIDSAERSHPLVVRRAPGAAGPRVVAFACLWRVHDELWINNLAVHPSFRRRGLARRLLGEALALGRRYYCSQALLEVRPSNEEAIQLYRAEGFRAVGRRPRYYTDNQEDALLMVARLGAARLSGWKRVLGR